MENSSAPADFTTAPLQKLNITDIKKIIPHRYPFLLIDRVDILEEGQRAIGYKCVTGNEAFFQGHFPERPIMPGVLIVESMAQTGCVILLRQPGLEGKLAFFMGIDAVKFRKPVVPGDVVELRVVILRAGSRVGKARGEAFVAGQKVTEAEFTFSVIDN
ncbi:MAG TPA: 3-hydroxyacyl-ACP dehydratase FabZ [Elusimicrobiota bacterium]|nr:3-hydroxyacyl-ACP dehydratase FabZ [Elusimicrobiota bacterium]